jgi:uncharacterized membrane protein YhiD involved in acid resistance
MSEVLAESVARFVVKQIVAASLGALVGLQREFGYLVPLLFEARAAAAAAAAAARDSEPRLGGLRTPSPPRPSRAAAHRPVRRAGLRTHMLVALGACLFSEASWSAFAVPVPARSDGEPFVAGAFNYDTSRVAAQIVSGVGFLGAGTIWKSAEGGGTNGEKVFGLTTAASLWVTASIGTHVGGANIDKPGGPPFLGPCVATLIVILTLQALAHVESAIHDAWASLATRYQSGRVVLRIAPKDREKNVAQIARDALRAVETATGAAVAAFAAEVETERLDDKTSSGEPARDDRGRQQRPAYSYPPPRPPRTGAAKSSDGGVSRGGGVSGGGSPSPSSSSSSSSSPSRVVRLRVTFVLPPNTDGLGLLDALAATPGAVSASVDESRATALTTAAGGALDDDDERGDGCGLGLGTGEDDGAGWEEGARLLAEPLVRGARE